jgi:ubiquinone biosynthesis protein
VQACKAVARPIIGKPLNEISIAKLLGQMFAIAAEFEMEVQPQLLLMQKTLMVAEGVGRMLNPNLNMWELARPMIEQWAAENFSAKARTRHAALEAKKMAYKLPAMLNHLEQALQALGDKDGIKMHPDSMKSAQAARQAIHKQWLLFAWAVLVSAIVVFVVMQ